VSAPYVSRFARACPILLNWLPSGASLFRLLNCALDIAVEGSIYPRLLHGGILENGEGQCRFSYSYASARTGAP
jgi:hypothetical protein